jgi:FTR1 family protein
MERSPSWPARVVLAACIAALILGGLLGPGARGATAASATPATPDAIATGAGQAQGAGSVSKDDAIKALRKVRVSIDQTLDLLDHGKRKEAFRVSKAGYLDHFEIVEIPLVIVDANLKLEAEAQFAEIRNAISDNESTASIRKKIVTLRGTINDAERRLTSQGAAPLLVFGQAFTVLLREGLEAVLLLSVLLGYLESTKNGRFKRPILVGVALAVVASIGTFLAIDAIFSVLPFGREVFEAIVGILAVAVLFYVSFWLVARLEQRRWLEFLKGKVWTAVSAGSAASLMAIGFTSVYREGFEMALFFQAIASFGTGMGHWVLAGSLAGAAVLGAISFAIFRYGKKLPIRTFLAIAVIVVMATSVAILGNALYALQESATIEMRRLHGWPQLPIYFSQAVGYYPTVASVVGQIALTAVYLLGGLYTFVIRPMRRRRAEAHADAHRPDAPPEPAVVGSVEAEDGPAGAALGSGAGVNGSPATLPVGVEAVRASNGVATNGRPHRRTTPGGIRVGVDVGGTFTKAVAFDLAAREVVARAVVPTTHDAAEGPAAGVVRVVHEVADAVGVERVDLVTHSTTQAVNALLEGDVETVGVLGMGREPDLRKARRRTRLDHVELSPGKRLHVVPQFLDITEGLTCDALAGALDRMQSGGATAVCVAEAFAPEGGLDEQRAVAAARERGLPTCGSSEMTGLYGLELRAVTAALNASILPIAVRTDEFVERGVAEAGIDAPVMVMRGDGGATDPEGFRREPARTLYSGPAASVAGVLRFTQIKDGVVIEVGGTSTNVAAIKAGKPALSYVQVASHATAVRALDVRVLGVAGGSMLRVRHGHVYGVGPRSAHIAGLPYCCYLDVADLEGARAELIAPRNGDPADHVVLRLADGRSAAVTNTCAAVALGVPEAGDYAALDAHPDAARAGLAAAGELVGLDGDEVARRMLQASADALSELVGAVVAEFELERPTLVAVGGGAGGLGRWLASTLGLECIVPTGAEVISSIGDALSLVRTEVERTVVSPSAADSDAVAAEAEAAVLAAGASADSVDVRVEFEAERSTLRAIATGAVGLEAGALPGRPPIDADQAAAIAGESGLPAPVPAGSFWVAGGANGTTGRRRRNRFGDVVVLDRFGDRLAGGPGGAVSGGDQAAVEKVAALVDACTKRVGPMTVAPSVWLVGGTRMIGVAGREVDEAVRRLADDPDPSMVVVIRD